MRDQRFFEMREERFSMRDHQFGEPPCIVDQFGPHTQHVNLKISVKNRLYREVEHGSGFGAFLERGGKPHC